MKTAKTTSEIVLEGGETTIPAGTKVEVTDHLDDDTYIVRFVGDNRHAIRFAVTADEIQFTS